MRLAKTLHFASDIATNMPKDVLSLLRKIGLNSVCLYHTAILCFFAMIQYRLIGIMHAHNFGPTVEIAQGVINGTPHWRAFQNRLLGPWGVQVLSELTGWPFAFSYNIFLLFLLVTSNIVIYTVFSNILSSTRHSLLYTLFADTMFIAMQDSYWLCVWDIIDLIVFFLFSYGMFSRKSLKFFVLIFLVELMNRESALFIAVWMIVDSIERRIGPENEYHIENKEKLTVGILLCVISVMFTKFVRDALFIKSAYEQVEMDISHEAIGNHFYFLENISTFLHNFYPLNINITINIVMLYLFYQLCINIKRFSFYELKILVVVLMMCISIFLFGLINETRVWFITIPFILMYKVRLDEKPDFQEVAKPAESKRIC